MDDLILTVDLKKRYRSDILIILGLFVAISALCAYVVLSKSGLQSFLLTEALVAIALSWTVFRSLKSGVKSLHLKGDSMQVIYADGRKYNISDVDRSYFKLKQTKKEEKLDIGALHIESTNFRVLHIQEFSKLKQYMSTHFEGEKKSIYYLDDEDK